MRKAKLQAEFHDRLGMFNAEEASIMSDFARNMAEFEDSYLEDCEDRGLIPMKLNSSLIVARFLSLTILAAQDAQRQYGVPASVLISLALYLSGWEAHGLFESREAITNWPVQVHEWFLVKAKLLAESPQYSVARPLVNDLRAYVLKIFSVGVPDKSGDKIAGEDILSAIENHDLEECDLAGILFPTEYRKSRFEAVRDESGVMQLRPFDLRKVAAMRRAAEAEVQAA